MHLSAVPGNFAKTVATRSEDDDFPGIGVRTRYVCCVRQERTAPLLHLGPVPEASSQARRFVRDRLRLLGVESLTDSAELGVSELVTNACLHARTEITVGLHLLESGAVRIEVSDDSPRQPRKQAFNPMATTGRGLRLLSAYGTWGVEDAVGGKTVWFQPASAAASRSASSALEQWPELG
jgi:anti-sigma regulatory factor (Ser/Thr protein kinase)